jgi:hypothetical protein
LLARRRLLVDLHPQATAQPLRLLTLRECSFCSSLIGIRFLTASSRSPRQ